MLDKIFINKINTILDKDIITNSLTKPKIISIEKKYRLFFPEDYKIFLLKYGGNYIADDYLYKPIEKSPVTANDGYDMMNYFLGDDIEENIKDYYEIFKDNVFPIAKAPGGDLVCLGSKGKYTGKVYSWWHENEIDDDPDNIRATLYLIANNFRDFIFSFEYHVW